MTKIPASTRLSVFDSYEGFDLNHQASLYTEFRRLATSRGWKRGSKSNKTFDKAWRRCFGSDILVGRNVDRYISEDGVDDEDVSALILKLQDLNIKEKPLTKITRNRVVEEFASYYGADASRLEKWQDICRDCGIESVPTSIKQCRKALKGVSINIYHFLEAKRDGRIPYRFPSKSALTKYMRETPKMFYPLPEAKVNEFLRIFLVQCW